MIAPESPGAAAKVMEGAVSGVLWPLMRPQSDEPVESSEGPPASSTIEAWRSMVLVRAPILPGGMCPGQRRINGIESISS